VVGASPPHRILEANAGFLGLFMLRPADVAAASLRVLQGPATDKQARYLSNGKRG
jgi:hypothetical protein